jgi:CheY-like chemotaxis protein
MIAETGRQGIQRAIRESPEVIILDLGLADMDGCKVVQQIRSEPSGSAPVILAYSGYHHREAEAREAGCDAFVLKPAVEELESLIQGTRDQVRQFAETAGPAVTRRR